MRFIYINTENIFPHDTHIINGLHELGHVVTEICDKSPGIKKYIAIAKLLRAHKQPYDAIIIGYTCSNFVPIVRLISWKKIIFNAVSSQYEANVVSREENSSRYLKTIKWLTIDFLSFHLASKVLLESNSQIKYISGLFFVPLKKLIRSWTGFNEKEFFYDPTITKLNDFTVLFRGRFLPESGILTVIEAAKILENDNIKFLVIGHGFMYRKVNALMTGLSPKNLVMHNLKLPIKELRDLMLSCHISLGQLADHPRLDRTLPCKLFETLALELPYLTGRNKAALELLTENQNCFCANPGDANDLAKKVLWLKNNPQEYVRVGKNGYKLYKEKLTSKKLTQEVIDACFR